MYYARGLLRLPINSSKSRACTRACCTKVCFDAMLTTRGGPLAPWRGYSSSTCWIPASRGGPMCLDHGSVDLRWTPLLL